MSEEKPSQGEKEMLRTTVRKMFPSTGLDFIHALRQQDQMHRLISSTKFTIKVDIVAAGDTLKDKLEDYASLLHDNLQKGLGMPVFPLIHNNAVYLTVFGLTRNAGQDKRLKDLIGHLSELFVEQYAPEYSVNS